MSTEDVSQKLSDASTTSLVEKGSVLLGRVRKSHRKIRVKRSNGSSSASPAETRRSVACRQTWASTGVTSDFIAPDDENTTKFSLVTRIAYKYQESLVGQLLFALILMLDVTTCCIEADMSAQGKQTPLWLRAIGVGSFCFFGLDAFATVLCKGRDIVHDAWFLVDSVVIAGGAVEVAVIIADLEECSECGILTMLPALRVIRAFRLLSLVRRVECLKEMRKLALMICSCMKSLFWSFVFRFLVMTLWSLIAVQYIHPIIVRMTWADCESCPRSFSSIMQANLTLFKTVVAGDSWGLVAEPVIKQQPWTAIVFLGSHITIIFGVLNLVVAVVVDEFADRRERDVRTMAHNMEADRAKDIKILRRIFHMVDSDGDGFLTLEELRQGARLDEDFRALLRVMDIDEGDLHQLFMMLDHDRSGRVDPHEFLKALSRWQTESRTAARFTKYNKLKVMQQQDELQASLNRLEDKFEQSMNSCQGDSVRSPDYVSECGSSVANLVKAPTMWRDILGSKRELALPDLSAPANSVSRPGISADSLCDELLALSSEPSSALPCISQDMALRNQHGDPSIQDKDSECIAQNIAWQVQHPMWGPDEDDGNDNICDPHYGGHAEQPGAAEHCVRV